MTNKDIVKIGKMLSDTGKSQLKEFDIVFVIDATDSMKPYIEAAKMTAEDISKTLRQKFPDTNFQYGYVFYRDPIDSHKDFHEIINLTDNVNSLPEKIGKIKAQGGGDLPEDWAGAYKKVNEEIKWRNGTKVIFHLADAGAHGKLFTFSDKYPDEEQKLINELNICCEQKIKIFGFVIKEDARNTFEKCKEIYLKKGGIYEIYNLEASSFGGIYSYMPPKKFDESKSLFGDIKYNLFEKKEDDTNKNTNLFGNNNIFGVKEKNNKNNDDTTSLFGTDKNDSKSNSLFGTNKNDSKSNSLFGTDKNNNNTTSLFGTDKNNNNTTSLFGTNNNTANIFANIISDNKRNIFEKNEEINNQSKSLFLNNKNNNELFDFRKNKTDNNLFGDIIENNNNNHSLFGNVEENNNNINTLFGNTRENNNDKNYQGLFGNSQDNQDIAEIKEKNSYKDMGYQSRLNSSFFNLVVNSIQNVNKNEINLFNNKNNYN